MIHPFHNPFQPLEGLGGMPGDQMEVALSLQSFAVDEELEFAGDPSNECSGSNQCTGSQHCTNSNVCTKSNQCVGSNQCG